MTERRFGFIAMLVVMLLVISCANRGDDSLRSDATAEEFVAVVSKDISFMFDPFPTPDEAVRASDLVVEGRIVDAQPGATVTTTSTLPPCAVQIEEARAAGDAIEDCTEPDAVNVLHAFIDLSIEVKTVLVGEGIASGDLVSVQVEVSPISIEESLKAVPPTDVLVLAADESDWQPDGRLEIPGKEGGDSFFVPFSQGFWLLSDDQKAVGLYTGTDSLGEGWGSPETFDDVVNLVGSALE